MKGISHWKWSVMQHVDIAGHAVMLLRSGAEGEPAGQTRNGNGMVDGGGGDYRNPAGDSVIVGKDGTRSCLFNMQHDHYPYQLSTSSSSESSNTGVGTA